MNPDQLDTAWQSLTKPDNAEHLEAVHISANDVWVAVDYEGLRHLLLSVPDGTETPTTITRGLRVTVSRHQVQGRDPADYLDLTCLSDDLAPTFTAVAADIGDEAETALPNLRVAAVIAALGRWQWFWGVETDRLTEQEALGLFAELWFLYRWEGGSPEAIKAWTASSGSRHDFQWRERSVEVKATGRRAGGAVLHHIQHLDQLSDPEEGDLYLFSLRIVRDELARNTLPNLVDHITEGLRGNTQAKDDLARKLGQRGYSPAFRHRHETPYRILEEDIYHVGPGFPRLTVNSFVGGLQPGITDVSYMIDMASCDDWLIATNPDGWEAV